MASPRSQLLDSFQSLVYPGLEKEYECPVDRKNNNGNFDSRDNDNYENKAARRRSGKNHKSSHRKRNTSTGRHKNVNDYAKDVYVSSEHEWASGDDRTSKRNNHRTEKCNGMSTNRRTQSRRSNIRPSVRGAKIQKNLSDESITSIFSDLESEHPGGGKAHTSCEHNKSKNLNDCNARSSSVPNFVTEQKRPSIRMYKRGNVSSVLSSSLHTSEPRERRGGTHNRKTYNESSDRRHSIRGNSSDKFSVCQQEGDNVKNFSFFSSSTQACMTVERTCSADVYNNGNQLSALSSSVPSVAPSERRGRNRELRNAHDSSKRRDNNHGGKSSKNCSLESSLDLAFNESSNGRQPRSRIRPSLHDAKSLKNYSKESITKVASDLESEHPKGGKAYTPGEYDRGKNVNDYYARSSSVPNFVAEERRRSIRMHKGGNASPILSSSLHISEPSDRRGNSRNHKTHNNRVCKSADFCSFESSNDLTFNASSHESRPRARRSMPVRYSLSGSSDTMVKRQSKTCSQQKKAVDVAERNVPAARLSKYLGAAARDKNTVDDSLEYLTRSTPIYTARAHNAHQEGVRRRQLATDAPEISFRRRVFDGEELSSDDDCSQDLSSVMQGYVAGNFQTRNSFYETDIADKSLNSLSIDDIFPSTRSNNNEEQSPVTHHTFRTTTYSKERFSDCIDAALSFELKEKKGATQMGPAADGIVSNMNMEAKKTEENQSLVPVRKHRPTNPTANSGQLTKKHTKHIIDVLQNSKRALLKPRDCRNSYMHISKDPTRQYR